MTRQERRALRQVKKVVARAMRQFYGASECRREDAEEYQKIQTDALSESQQSVPVCYVSTKNKGILETTV